MDVSTFWIRQCQHCLYQSQSAILPSCIFKRLDLVAQLGGAFVGFIFNRPRQFFAKFIEFRLPQAHGVVFLGSRLGDFDGFARVVIGAVLGAFDDAAELVDEEVVILGAAQKAGILEFLPAHAAVGAAGDGGVADLGVGFQELIEEFVDGDVGLLNVAGFLGAGVAQVDVV